MKASKESKKLSNVIAPWRWEAPELLSRMRVFSEKTDVFSFGCFLWELFARRHPFDWIDDGNVRQVRMKNGVSLDPKQRMGEDGRQRTPPVLIELMEKCVFIEPRDRPTMKEIHETLEVVLDELKGRNHCRNPQPSQPTNGNIEEKMDRFPQDVVSDWLLLV